jgi:polyhydroxyalkanoate synthase subunit PhaC
VDAVLSAADRAAMDIHARVERWALDEVALPGKLVSEIVELLYRENPYGQKIETAQRRQRSNIFGLGPVLHNKLAVDA